MTLYDYIQKKMSRYQWRKGEKKVISMSTGHYISNDRADTWARSCIGVCEDPWQILQIMPTWKRASVSITFGLTYDDQNIYVNNLAAEEGEDELPCHVNTR